MASDAIDLGHLTWPEAAERLKLVDVALLPVGATEQHGRHLPLDTDAHDAEYLAREVAKTWPGPEEQHKAGANQPPQLMSR